MYKKFSVLLIFVFGLIGFLNAQENKEAIIEKALETILENTDEQIETSELFEQMLELADHPINLNGDELFRLLEFKLISEQQYFHILEYIGNVGIIRNIQEIQFLDGFDQKSFEVIKPFICAEEPPSGKVKFHDLFYGVRQQAFFRYGRVIQKKSGYETVSDSAFMSQPNAHYLGSPAKYYSKYQIKSKHLKAGFVLEKDPGEVLFTNNYPIAEELLNKAVPLFDFSSIHLSLSNLGIIQQLIIGDYHMQFAQGLTMWSNFSFGKSSEVTATKRFAANLIPSSSTIENNFFRGFALHLNFGKPELVLFYSNKNRDANRSENDEDNQLWSVSSLQNTGLHRTINELNDRNVLNEQVLGSRISFKLGRFEIGSTAYKSKWDAPLLASGDLYKKFDFSGNQNGILGFDYQGFVNNIGLYGEWSRSENGGQAYLFGFDFYPDSYTKFNILYRNYPANYQNLFANAFAENTGPKNEKGLYVGFSNSFLPNWELNLYLDFFRFDWLKSNVCAPSHGVDYFAQITFNRSENLQCYLRYKRKKKQNNSPFDDWIDDLELESKENIRIDFSYKVLENFRFKSRAEWVNFKTASGQKETGILLFQQIQYTLPNNAMNLYFRCVNFNTDGYDSRIYTYENDVLYAFSIPAFYDRGNHFYFLLNYHLNKMMDCWLKFGHTFFHSKSLIGSGTELIDGPAKSEFRFQLRFKL